MSLVARGSSASPVAMPHHGTAAAAVSCGELPADLHRFRAVFPARWRSFLRSHFRDLLQVQFFFGVSERTARDWMDGRGSPRAEAVLVLVSRHPEAIPFLIGAA